MTLEERNNLCIRCLEAKATVFYSPTGNKIKRGYCQRCYEKAVTTHDDYVAKPKEDGPTITKQGAEQKGRKAISTQVLGGSPIDDEYHE